MLLGFLFRDAKLRKCQGFRRNMVFRQDGQILPHLLPRLPLADTIAITFEYQKRDECNDTVTQWRTGDSTYCPVVVSAAVVRRLEAMGASESNFIYKFKGDNGRTRNFDFATALRMLRGFNPQPPCGCSEVSSQALISKAWASTQSALDSTPFACGQPWQCVSTVYRCTPSCCLVAGPAKLSSATSGSKLSHLVAVSCPR